MKQLYSSIAILTIFIAISEYYTYQSGLATSELIPAILKSDKELFNALIVKFVFLLALSAILKSLTSFCSSYLSFVIRFEVLESLKLKFKLVDIDFDQRLTQDLELMCNKLSEIVTTMIPAPFMVVFYWYKSVEVAGDLSPIIIFGFVIVSFVVSSVIGKKVPSLVYSKEKSEGKLRMQFVNLKESEELIKLYNGMKVEMNNLQECLQILKKVQLKVILNLFDVDFWSQLVAYLGGILPYFVLSIVIFNSASDKINTLSSEDLAGVIQMAVFVLLMLMNRFTTILDKFPIIFEFIGYYKRVSETLKMMAEDEKPGNMETKYQFGTFGIENANAIANDGSTIFEKQSIVAHLNNSLFVTGENGCGKTTITRLIRNLWTNSTGTRVLPREAKWMVIPSNPYFVQGSIIQNIIYPLSDQDNIKPEDVLPYLKMMGLDFNSRIHSLMLNFDKSPLQAVLPLEFYKSLSIGEQQKLCLCRALFYRPEFLIMDESLNSVDEESTAEYFRFLKQHNCTFITISHNQHLEQYHERYLDLSPNDGEESRNTRAQRFGLF
eukprot:NODE_439_length_7399_cov_0.767397.p1 type:complete len:550 gc:universal NODE_439_length_7399_cov_0.767397:5010-6659(+)